MNMNVNMPNEQSKELYNINFSRILRTHMLSLYFLNFEFISFDFVSCCSIALRKNTMKII